MSNAQISRADEDSAAEAVESYFRDTSSSLDPYPAYDRLREVAPVYWSEPLGYWIVTGYEEGEALYRNANLSRHEASRRQLQWLYSADDPPEVLGVHSNFEDLATRRTLGHDVHVVRVVDDALDQVRESGSEQGVTPSRRRPRRPLR